MWIFTYEGLIWRFMKIYVWRYYMKVYSRCFRNCKMFQKILMVPLFCWNGEKIPNLFGTGINTEMPRKFGIGLYQCRIHRFGPFSSTDILWYNTKAFAIITKIYLLMCLQSKSLGCRLPCTDLSVKMKTQGCFEFETFSISMFIAPIFTNSL